MLGLRHHVAAGGIQTFFTEGVPYSALFLQNGGSGKATGLGMCRTRRQKWLAEVGQGCFLLHTVGCSAQRGGPNDNRGRFDDAGTGNFDRSTFVREGCDNSVYKFGEFAKQTCAPVSLHDFEFLRRKLLHPKLSPQAIHSGWRCQSTMYHLLHSTCVHRHVLPNTVRAHFTERAICLHAFAE